MDVENPTTRSHCLLDVAQDVHDVLGLHSSERPAEERELELSFRQLDLARVRDLEAQALAQLARRLVAGGRDDLLVRVEREHLRAFPRALEAQASLSAADL